MNAIQTGIQDLLIVEPKVYGDHRGWFVETWQKARYTEIGIAGEFVQDNMSFSKKGTLRGLHMQTPAQGKLVQVIDGVIWDVAVDLRKTSSTFGKWYGITLSSLDKKQFWVPEGFAHGFYVLSDTATFSYKCTKMYEPKSEIAILWNDVDIAIEWPFAGVKPLLSEKDMNAKPFKWWLDQNSF